MSWMETQDLALTLYEEYQTAKEKLSPEQYASLESAFGEEAVLAKSGKEVLAEFKHLLHREKQLKEMCNQYGHVLYKGKPLSLTDKPRMRASSGNPVEFFAIATDLTENLYLVVWETLPGFDPSETDGNYEQGINWEKVTITPSWKQGMSVDDITASMNPMK